MRGCNSFLIMAIVHILYPITEQTLRESLTRIRQHIDNTKPVIENLLKTGQLERHTIDHMTYLWPIDAMIKNLVGKAEDVKILAPFDPLVWDRRRFEHLWGWPYRFEAYTPRNKRVRGYYAMPLLWRDQIIGWANINVLNGNMEIDYGYIKEPIRDPQFNKKLQKEITNMEYFLGITS